MKGFFITATDTEAGKTFVTAGLLHSLSQQGYKTLGFKPIASGCQLTEQGLQNDDALQLIQAASVTLEYPLINPYAFEPAIAPHLAAYQAGVNIDLSVITKIIQEHQYKADYVLVEGVGGWLVPLSERETVADLAKRLGFPVIVVVNMRLGCINHALLTVQAIEQQGLKVTGWIANQAVNESRKLSTPMLNLAENIQALETRISAPLLGVIPDLTGQSAHLFAKFVDLNKCI